MRVRMNDLELRLNNTFWSLLIGALLAVVLLFVLLGLQGGLISICLCLGFLRGLLFMGLDLPVDIFLKLRLLLIHVHVVQKIIISLGSHRHELRFATVSLAVDMLHYFVIAAQFLFI